MSILPLKKPVICQHCRTVIGEAATLDAVRVLADVHEPYCDYTHEVDCPDAVRKRRG